MPTYNVHVPEVRTASQKAAAIAIPMFTRSGREVLKILGFNRETRRVICAVEKGEHTYDYSDLLHHLGDAGKRAHFEAAGYPLKNAHVHRAFAPLLDAISGCYFGSRKCSSGELCEDCTESDAQERAL